MNLIRVSVHGNRNDEVLVSGPPAGELVVTAGVQKMAPGLNVALPGAALIRERVHGTIEHLLVMPVTPFEIMVSKVWSMALFVLIVTPCSLLFVVQGVLSVPIQGSITLFLAGMALFVFATTSLGILLATFARSMPQFGLLLMLVPLQILSGATTPYERLFCLRAFGTDMCSIFFNTAPALFCHNLRPPGPVLPGRAREEFR